MKVLLHTQHRVTEDVKAILKEAKRLSGVEEEIQFAPLDDGFVPPKGVPVLSLGSYKRRGQERVVQTYSVKQIMAKADSLTRLSNAFKLLDKTPDLPEFKYHVATAEDYYSVITRLLPHKELAVDIETRGSVDAQVPGWEYIISLAFYDGECAYVFPEELLRDEHVQECLLTLLRRTKSILHNGKFDCKYFTGGVPIYPAFDTMLMHYAAYPAASIHDLKGLALAYFGAEDWDTKAKEHLNGRQVKTHTVLEDGAYATPDVVYTAKNGYERIPRTMLYEYNCIAEGQLVLTDSGLVPIEDVKLSHKLWDGLEWVTHEGVILKGTRPVIELDGLVLTPDHLVLTESGEYVCAAGLKQGNRRAVVGANGSTPVRAFGANRQGLAGETAQVGGGSLLSVSPDLLQEGELAPARGGNNMQLPKFRTLREESLSQGSEGSPPRNGTTVRTQQDLRGEWYPSEVQGSRELHTLGTCGVSGDRLQGSPVRQDQQLRTLRAGESEAGHGAGERHESFGQRICAVHGAGCGTASSLAPTEDGPSRVEDGARWSGAVNSEGEHRSDNLGERPTKRVFDILNAGPRYRFTVSGVIVSNCRDVYWTWHLKQVFQVLVDGDPVATKLLNAHMIPVSEMFQRVETPGVRFDTPYMEERAEMLDAEALELRAELAEAVGWEMNPNSWQQVKRYFHSIGHMIKKTDAEVMEGLVVDHQDPVAKLILACRGNTKTNGTYTTGYLKQTIAGRGYPTFKVHAASTGRIGGGGPSLLTIPRDKKIKKMVLPDEGHVLVGADLSQAELRVMAIESNDPWMIAAFQPGAGDFFDLLMENTYTDLDAVAHKRDNPQEYTDLRAKFKGVVYGVSFGRKEKAIAYALGITVAEARELMTAFVRPGSPFAEWRKMIERKAVGSEVIENRFGRKFQAELITRSNRQNVINSALSFMSQSTANDICLSAAVVVEKELPQFDNARLLSTLHDALYSSTPQERADEVGQFLANELEAAGRRVYGDLVAFKSDFGWGNNLAEA